MDGLTFAPSLFFAKLPTLEGSGFAQRASLWKVDPVPPMAHVGMQFYFWEAVFRLYLDTDIVMCVSSTHVNNGLVPFSLSRGESLPLDSAGLPFPCVSQVRAFYYVLLVH